MKATVYGRVYSEGATYSSWDAKEEFPHYDLECEEVWEIDCASLTEANAWLAANHPEFFMGASIVCENGDFAMHAVPGPSYWKGDYETKAKRLAYVASLKFQ